MAELLRLFGNELSPYSVKVRSYLRYKNIPHVWIVRDATNQEEFARHAKLPLIPLLVFPDGTSMQDSTPIIEHLERRYPEPSIHPDDPALAFLSALLEEYADEWGNKPMFHYRWFYDADAASAADRLARSMQPGIEGDALGQLRDAVRGRMVPRLSFVGSSAATKGQIEGSFLRQLDLLEEHLAARAYVFGGRPAFGDFGLAGQLYELSIDPTPGAIMRRGYPRVLAWVERMLHPRAEGGFEPWSALAPTLTPLLREEVARIFLPWSTANARALAAGTKEFTVELDGRPFTQETQKYHAKSLAALRDRYARVADRSALDPILADTGCLSYLS
ncbi:MAG TPA: glutathione S-transferase family protein [Candidatus Limnocylindria bacterium]|nr:glutathione S-transferase family protein [Candidatus Limnocylindria bacterium]